MHRNPIPYPYQHRACELSRLRVSACCALAGAAPAAKAMRPHLSRRASAAAVLCAALGSAGSTSRLLSQSGATENGEAASGLAQSNHTHQTQIEDSNILLCYSGLLGGCLKCDAEGSCICGGKRNGHSDYLPMDRSRWGQSTLLCPNQNVVVYVFLSISAVLTVEAIWRSWLVGRKQYVFAARGKSFRSHQITLCSIASGLMALLCQLAFVVIKFALPDQLIAVNFLPTSVLLLRSVFLYVMTECDYVRYFNIALTAQEKSIGRHRVQEAMQHRVRGIPKQVCRATVASMIPLVGCVMTSLGYAASIELQASLLLTTIVVENASGFAFSLIKYWQCRTLIETFDKCIQAVQAAYVTANGGASCLEASTLAGSSADKAGVVPSAAVLELLQEQAHMNAAKAEVHAKMREAKLATVGLVCTVTPFLIIPPLLSRMTYCVIGQSIGLALFVRRTQMLYMSARFTEDGRRIQRV